MAFRQINTADKNLQLVQANVADAIRILDLSDLVGGNLIQGITLSSGDNTIDHKLGRTPLKWIIVDITSAATIYRTSWDDKHLVLHSSATAAVTLWVN